MSDPVQVTDDQVLQVMNQLDLDAESLEDFRVVRFYLQRRLPLCCIAFMLKIKLLGELWLPGIEEAGRLTDAKSKRVRNFAMFTVDYYRYVIWAASALEEAGFPDNYTPCPACVLAKNFVAIPSGCPCCQDEEQDTVRD